jgi:hypothetical protein
MQDTQTPVDTQNITENELLEKSLMPTLMDRISDNKKDQKKYFKKLNEATNEEEISRAFVEHYLQVVIGRFYETALTLQLNSTEMWEFSEECFKSGYWAWPETSDIPQLYKFINFWHNVTIRLIERNKKLKN